VVLRLFPNCPFAAIPRNSDDTADETAVSAVSFQVKRPDEGSAIELDPLPLRQIKIADKSNFLEYMGPRFEMLSLGNRLSC
jgi:hypothetical protein